MNLSDHPTPGTRGKALAVGVAVWFFATVLLRSFDLALIFTNGPIQLLVYMSGVFAVSCLVYLVEKWFEAPPLEIAVCLVVPGMLLDAAVLHFWDFVFPDYPAEEERFGALLLWLYGTALLAGLGLDRHRIPGAVRKPLGRAD